MDGAKELSSVSVQDRRSMWQRHIEQSQEGQISVRRYCREHHLSEAGFYYWRQRLQGKKKVLSKSSRFSRVQVSKEVFASRIRLELGQGLVLCFDQEPSPSWIRELVTTLGGGGS